MIALQQVTLKLGAFELRDIAFEVEAGSHTVLMGRTGAGKTTLLEAICGLRRISSGRVILGGRDVTEAPPGARGIGFVPQDGALFQHLTVREHLAFSLKVREWELQRMESRVMELSDWLGLGALLDRTPAGLSGGEAQRVALGRAIASSPEVLCLDEPLSALDDETRAEVCGVLTELRERTHITILHITHNRHEADRLADRVLVLRDGRVGVESSSV